MIRDPRAMACVLLGLTIASTTAACRAADVPVPVAESAETSASALVSSDAPPEPPAPTTAPSASVAPADPTRSVGATPLQGNDLVKKAEQCLDDPRCGLEDAARLFLQAADARATDMDCFRLYHGVGVPIDLPRARACFERSVSAEKGYRGSSPSLERLFLGSMLFDGQGGPRETERGKALFVDCFEDSSVSWLRQEADQRAADGDPSLDPLDFCDDIGGTTLSMQRCGALELNKAAFEAQKAMKALAPQLDAEGIVLARKAAAAWSTVAVKDAEEWSDIYRNGSIRSLIYLGRRAAREHDRAKALQSLFDYAPGQDDPAIADKDLDREYRAALASRDAEGKKLLVAAQAAWRTYRTAEVAFYRRALGKRRDEAAVARDITARLTRARIAALTEPREP
jgi:uncharacterized protein YecT (DUF1311 family)